MNDRYVITWKTSRGEFRIWDNYSDRSKDVARELMSMGALGVEVWRADQEKVIFKRGVKVDPT